MKEPAAPTNLTLPWEEPPSAGQLRDLVSEIKWSHSRRTVFEQCPRRYYYEYYGAKAGSSDPEKTVLRVLKSLQNRHERVGTIAHLVISTYFRKAQTGEIWTAERLANWARDMLLKDQAYSRAYSQGRILPTGKFPPVVLQEYYYGYPDAQALCLEVEKRLQQAVNNFTSNPSFDEFRRTGAQKSSLVEHRLSLPGLPCQVDGRLDLAFPSSEGGTVVDWKLGDPSGDGNDSLQLAAYALWAAQQFACGPHEINICKAYLVAEHISFFKANGKTFANARARIVQDAERMAALHDYGRRGMVKAFTPCAQRDVCKLCPFQEVCPEGRAVLNARN